MAANVLLQILPAAGLPGSLSGSQRPFQAVQGQAALQQPRAQGQAALQLLHPQLLQLLQLLAMLRLHSQLRNLRKQPVCITLASTFHRAVTMTCLMLRAAMWADSDGGQTRT